MQYQDVRRHGNLICGAIVRLRLCQRSRPGPDLLRRAPNLTQSRSRYLGSLRSPDIAARRQAQRQLLCVHAPLSAPDGLEGRYDGVPVTKPDAWQICNGCVRDDGLLLLCAQLLCLLVQNEVHGALEPHLVRDPSIGFPLHGGSHLQRQSRLSHCECSHDCTVGLFCGPQFDCNPRHSQSGRKLLCSSSRAGRLDHSVPQKMSRI